MNKSLLLIVFYYCLFSPQLFAQNIILEQNPPTLQWLQTNTQHFRVIFPEGFEDEALRTANTLEHLYRPVSRSLGREPRKIPVILQNQTVLSNAFVTLSPRRIEFYTMPPQDYNFLGTNNWIDLLAVHEFRHVVQYEKSITGFNKLIWYLFGNEALSAMSFMAVPLWFWEGDAVATETALTESGRGRIPYFDMVFRANLLERGPFNYSKQYLRSFKHFIPNHYVTGYFLTTHLRRNHDPLIWARVTDRAFRLPFIPFTFSLALRRETGQGVNKTYKSMIAEVDSLWRQQQQELDISESKPINTRKSQTYTNYEFPQPLPDGKILALRSGIGDIQQFVSLDEEGRENLIFTPGYMNLAKMLSVQNNKIIWNEFHPDIRWRAKNFSVIKTYDIAKKELKVLSSRSRYNAAALSPDGKKVVTIEVTENNENRVVILDAVSGEVLIKIPNPENRFYSMPRWSDDNLNVIALKHKENTKSFALINTGTLSENEIFEWETINVGHPVMFRQYIFFNAPFNGLDNIYVYNIENKVLYQVTKAKYGAFNPAITPDGNFIIYNDFQVNGMDVVKIPFNSEEWVPLDDIKIHHINYYEPLVEQEQYPKILEDVPEIEYPVRRFNRFKGIINPYSWGATISPDDRQIFIGASSQDILSTTSITAGLNIYANEATANGFAQVSYQGLFPIIDLGANYGYRAIQQSFQDTLRDISWNEMGFNAGLRLPLLLTRSKYAESLNLSAVSSINRVENYDFRTRRAEQQANGLLSSMRYSITYLRMLKRSQRDLVSRFGQSLFIQFQHTPFGGDYISQLFASEANLFFPGLFKHHSLQLRLGVQLENAGNYMFRSPLFFPRGYAYRSHQLFYNGAVQYRFPIFYPDLTLGPILNIQRVKANLFYDYGQGFNANFIEGRPDRTYNSLGVDLTMDFNFMRFLLLLEIGARFTYIPEINDYSIQLLFGQFGF